MSKPHSLDRLLSKLGIASRGQSAKWIEAGKVSVNGKVVRDPQTWVNWPQDSVALDKKEISAKAGRFFLFHKPCGYITSHSDEHGRKTIYDLLPSEIGFIHAVGRLDKATSGLLLLTNDSMLSSYLTDPKNKIERVYQATVWGKFTEEKLAAAKIGLMDEGEHLKCERAKILNFSRRETVLELVLVQGKNREVRRLCKALGHEVTNLRRIQYGPFKLGDLPLGACQEIPLPEAMKACSTGES